MRIIEEKRLEYLEEHDRPHPVRYVTDKPRKHTYGLFDGDTLVWPYKTYRDPEVRKKEIVKSHKDKYKSKFKDYLIEHGTKRSKNQITESRLIFIIFFSVIKNENQ